MDALLNASLSHVWPTIGSLTRLETPDDAVGRGFKIANFGQEAVRIETEAGSPITIQRVAFLEALRYLLKHGHDTEHPCEIRSNQVAEQAGPLCAATREVNGNTRVINYIVPILVEVGLLGVSGTRPNTTWLA
jgi:hypothetical protein